jgi:hypothetical protein
VQFSQEDQAIQANMKALIRTIHKTTAQTQIPLELSLYSTMSHTITRQHPHLTIQSTIHVPKLKADGTPELQRPNTVYPPDRAGYRSNASFVIPIADFPGVGHPKHLRPKRFIKRYAADAEWTAAEGKNLELSKYEAGIRDLQKKKYVYEWTITRTDEDKERERKQGLRRSGDLIKKPKKLPA